MPVMDYLFRLTAAGSAGLHVGCVGLLLCLGVTCAGADETRLSPFIPRIKGQEDFIYVWTAGVSGLGDERDKLVTIGANPGSDTYGRVIQRASVPGRNEAFQAGLTSDRRYLWAGGLDTSKIFVFELHSEPAAPRHTNTVEDISSSSGGVAGPNAFHALPHHMLISGLSNARDRRGNTGLVEYTNAGDYIATYTMPTRASTSAIAGSERTTGHGFDVRVLPRLNAVVTSSFTGAVSYLGSLDKLLANPESQTRIGRSAVIWKLDTREPMQILDIPGAPLGIRCVSNEEKNFCFTATLMTSKLWLLNPDKQGKWRSTAVATIGNPTKRPMPVDLSMSRDQSLLWVVTWNDGKARAFDIKDPFHPREIYSAKIGAQISRVSQSRDGDRIYFASSLLGKWDKIQAATGEDLQYVKAYSWDGKKLTQRFSVDFLKEKLGHPRHLALGAYSLYNQQRPVIAWR